MRDLGAQHVGHAVRHRPHALADLRTTGQPAAQAHVDIRALVGVEPDGIADFALAQHRARNHRRVQLITGAVEEAGVDEHHALARGADALHEIERRAPLLVHDAHLQRVALEPEQLLDAAEQSHGQRHFLRTVQFRLDDIDRTAATVARAAARLQIVQSDQRADGRIEHGLWHRLAVDTHHVAHHVVADVAHQHEAAARELQFAAVRRRVNAVGVQPARNLGSAFGKIRCERAAHQAQPVAVSRDLVGRVDRGHGILQILNRRERRFQHQVADSGGIATSNRVRAIDLYLEVQAMMAQQHDGGVRRGALKTHERRRML